MAIEIPGWPEPVSIRRTFRAVRVRAWRFGRRLFGHYRFNSITRRIIVINLLGVAVLVAGIFYANQYRVTFVTNRVENITSQAEIIANAIAQTSKNNSESSTEGDQKSGENGIVVSRGLANPELSFRIDPETVSPMLRDLVGPTKTRARVFDTDGTLISDSRLTYGRGPAGRAEPSETATDIFGELWSHLKSMWEPDLPLYKDMGGDGKSYEEVRVALAGSTVPIMRMTQSGESIFSIAVPIQRDHTILGALMLTTQGSDIDELIAKERWQIVGLAALVVFVTGVLSLILAGTIAEPMRRLATAADRVRKNIKSREQIPDFGERQDEIGHLAVALREMTNALYSRLDAIESFAADVSHELKNPLSSLQSAAEQLSTNKSEADQRELINIIHHDVRRLDRLITDISDASRLDAELARESAKPVNLASLLDTLCEITRESKSRSGLNIILSIQGLSTPAQFAKSSDYMVNGHDSRLSQVIVNLIDNAASFSPEGGSIYLSARRMPKQNEIEICVEDEGPGIREENLEKIFDRFYTDRPEDFGQNSGLGLNISLQIVKAHGGSIWAENRTSAQPIGFKPARATKRKRNGVKHACNGSLGKQERFACGQLERHSFGARFVIRLPACKKT